MSQHLTVHTGREEEEGKAKFFLPAVNFQPHCFSCWRTVFLFFWAEMQVVGWEQNLLLWMWSWENPQGSSKLWFQPRQDFRNMARHLNFSAGSAKSRAKSFLPHPRNSQTEFTPWDALSSRVIPVKMNALVLPRHVSHLCEKWKLREVM